MGSRWLLPTRARVIQSNRAPASPLQSRSDSRRRLRARNGRQASVRRRLIASHLAPASVEQQHAVSLVRRRQHRPVAPETRHTHVAEPPHSGWASTAVRIVKPRAPPRGYLRPVPFGRRHPHRRDRDTWVFSDVTRRTRNRGGGQASPITGSGDRFRWSREGQIRAVESGFRYLRRRDSCGPCYGRSIRTTTE